MIQLLEAFLYAVCVLGIIFTAHVLGEAMGEAVREIEKWREHRRLKRSFEEARQKKENS